VSFPENFRMITGDLRSRSNSGSIAQKAISFLCLDFQGQSVRFDGLPPQPCRSGVRAQITFPQCWDGINPDSPDHKSHVVFPSTGFDSGICDPGPFNHRLPRIFVEIYYATNVFDFNQGKNKAQPFVFAQGDPTGYGYHGDFINGWDAGVLSNNSIQQCKCDIFGGTDCCIKEGLFTKNTDTCHITNGWNETTTGRIPKLPGDNPVSYGPDNATPQPISFFPAKIDPVIAYIGDKPPTTGTVVGSDSNVLVNIPTNTSPLAVSSSPATVPTQSTTPPKDSSPTPLPPSTVAKPTPTPSPTTTHGGFCYSSKDNMKHPRGLRKRHLHHSNHHGEVGGFF